METATDSNGGYSRKRPFSTTDTETTGGEKTYGTKRSNSSSNNEVVPLLKILIPNYAAGAIIGKGGTNISELQNQYGAKIRLSPSREFYPGTEERIVILTGEVNQIVDLNNYIIDKVHIDSTEGPGVKIGDEERGQKVKIVVPNQTAGLIIGRAGATIKALQEETGAKIMISSRDEAKVPGERIITISGNTDQRTEATRKVVLKIAADPENMSKKNLTYNAGSMRNMNGGSGRYNPMDVNQALGNNLSSLHSMMQQAQNPNSNQNLLASLAAQNPLAVLQQSGITNQRLASVGGLAGLGNQQLASMSGISGAGGSIVDNIKTTVTINMEIPDILVGAILGKQGKTVHEFIQFSGAKIQFSGKNEFAPGTTDRLLTIQGDVNQTQIAYFLINQKIALAENELATGIQRP